MSGYTVKAPSSILLCGPSMSGKSTLITHLIRHSQSYFEPTPVKWIYFYGIDSNELPRDLPNVTFVKGMPDEETLSLYRDERGGTTGIVLDDLLTSLNRQRDTFQNFMIRATHHLNLVLIITAHSLFAINRLCRINAHYIILTKSPSDVLTLSNLARQIMPGKVNNVLEAYADATSKPYGHLCIDLNQKTADNQRLVSNILSEPVFYIAKNNQTFKSNL